jgi:hypothetical protein
MAPLKFAVNEILILALDDIGRIHWQQLCHGETPHSRNGTPAKFQEKAKEKESMRRGSGRRRESRFDAAVHQI